MTSDPHHILQQFFGFSTFRPGQEEAICHLLNGDHSLVVMPTGAGKSLIYQLTALCLPAHAVTLVLSPLIALMKDQVDSLTQQDIPATYINSSLSASEQSRRLQNIVHGKYRLVYIAPERLRNMQFQQTMEHITIGLLVVDEAHCISHWGHDFRPDYRRIAQSREDMGNPLTVALTATATRLVQDDIVELLNIPAAQRVVTGFNRPNLSFEVLYAFDTSSKLFLLQTLLNEFKTEQQQHGGTAIVYTGTRRDTEEVAAFINREIGISADYYHAGLNSDRRATIQDGFLMGELPVVVATNAFGMGIDRPDVRMVIHYNLPGTLEAYYQEAGRAGRDGKPARAMLLYSPQDRLLQQWFIDNNKTSLQDLRTIHNVIYSSDGAERQHIQTTLDYVAEATRMDMVKVRMGLAHLEQAGIIQHTGDEGAYVQMRVWKWNKQAVEAVAANMYEYSHHRQLQLDQMTDYAEAHTCRRHILLRYFSDHSKAEADRCCDNCLVEQSPPPAKQDVNNLDRAERAALVILDALKRMKWGIGRKRLAELLKGSHAKKMSDYYRRHTYYGRFGDFSIVQIEDMIEQLILSGHLKIIGGDMPILSLSPRGVAALRVRAAIPFSLPDDNGTPANDKPRLAKRPKKNPADSETVCETENLFQQGLSPSEIAVQRGLKETTIYGHLSHLISDGRVALSSVISETTISQVETAIQEVGDSSKLIPLKERLPEHITFDEIRCVVKDVIRRNKRETENGEPNT